MQTCMMHICIMRKRASPTNKKPVECPVFATRCTPEHSLGATMVSSEGACAACYRYRRQRT